MAYKYKVMLMPNGGTAVFDEKGQQVPNLQVSWLVLYVRFLRTQGVDPEDCDIELLGMRHARWNNITDNWKVE